MKRQVKTNVEGAKNIYDNVEDNTRAIVKDWRKTNRNYAAAVNAPGEHVRIFTAVLIISVSAHAAAAENNACVHIFELKPNQRLSIAAVVSNGGMYKSRVLDFAGRVTTEDGTNRLAEVYLNHKDVFRFGSNEDIKSARGPIFNWKARLSFWGSGMAEVRVKAANTPTTICLCTETDVDDKSPGYPDRRKACMAFVSKQSS